MLPIALLAVGSALLSEIFLIVLIAIVLFIVFKVGGGFLKLIGGIVMNTILGLISLLFILPLFGVTIAISIFVLIAVAIFGLPGLFVLVILKLLGLIM